MKRAGFVIKLLNWASNIDLATLSMWRQVTRMATSRVLVTNVMLVVWNASKSRGLLIDRVVSGGWTAYRWQWLSA